MTSERITLTREELYKKVWAMPMRELAKSLQISDAGLAKICKRLTIPRPKQGYWLKDERNRARPPALPRAAKGIPLHVTFSPNKEIKPHATVNDPLLDLSSTIKTHRLVRECRQSFNGRPGNPDKIIRYFTCRISKSDSVTVLAGWDRPLQQYFLVITDDMPNSPFEEGIIYSNLQDPNEPSTDWDYFLVSCPNMALNCPTVLVKLSRVTGRSMPAIQFALGMRICT